MKLTHGVGKRKTSVARATIRKGKGNIRINTQPLQLKPRYIKMRIKEPLLLAKDLAPTLDVKINVKGGGIWSQADACRTAISNALVEWDNNLKDKFMDYDRALLISDARRTERHKTSRSSAGPRRSKQQSKR